MSLRNALDSLDEQGITYRFLGFMNIESNVVALSSRPFVRCEECLGTSDESVQFSCPHCGRTTENYIFINSGDGDGIYVVHELFAGEEKKGILAIFDSNYGLANHHRSLIEGGVVPTFEKSQVSQYFETHFSPLGSLATDSTIVIGDQFSDDDPSGYYVNLNSQGLTTSNFDVGGFFELPEEYSFAHEIGPRRTPTLRVLIAVDKAIGDSLRRFEEPVVSSWRDYLRDKSSEVVTSHLHVMADSVRMLNSAFAELQEQSGSHTTPSPQQPQVSELSKDAQAPRVELFCTNCGSQFGSSLEKFCSSCGHKRGHLGQ
jgi:rubrerythrin